MYKYDFHRYGGKPGRIAPFLFFFRKAKSSNILMKFISLIFLNLYKEFSGLEISSKTQIGKGLYLGHAFNITINPSTIIGENCNIHKGVTIGQENRGKRKGVPRIGNKVWIGVNSTIVGNLTIGDDVLIAPNSFVNCDIPSHSIVYGNPCVIKHKDNATSEYINNLI